MMERSFPERANRLVHPDKLSACGTLCAPTIAIALMALLTGAFAWGQGQVITIDTSGKGPIANGPVSRDFQQITPTHLELSKRPLDAKTRLLLVRYLESEQGFAMRPLPSGHKGLFLEANGDVKPAGEAWLDMATVYGVTAKPGQRVVITNVKIDHSEIVLDLNGGPDPAHRFLRHIQIGMGDPDYGDPTMPIVQDSGQVPTGARITLQFHHGIPELTGDQVESLLAPLISFKVQTPIEAYTATLPPQLKTAILDHEVWVGMNQEMVIYSMGQPVNKYRDETNGPTSDVIWMYGKPPQTVDFVRFNGNRVIRVEIARTGEPLEVFTQDRVTPLLMASGTTLTTAENVHPIQEGDVQRNPQTQAPLPPPTLGAPTDKYPQSKQNGPDQEGPVYFPPDSQDSGSASQPAQPAAQSTSPQPNAQPSTTLGQNPDVQPPSQPPANDSQRAQPAQSSPEQSAPQKEQQPDNYASGQSE